ncbi:uncharacterized protein GGS22DRAFT_197873 [Annulohypoxylon maeteangense]|uniref:uncharacterized protein n=1 Tax=Annulohypoxylon maeteangense TaxID=1927788 RepID=UPI0020074D52|nr:uncharacterized protein GGS22DRAFT_197873 [Annulohypoxylon maeteangense]KAI0887954.1 hypothetical protein GGS22DRAFT_197873 [Annulohypoxylon maeteangense]
MVYERPYDELRDASKYDFISELSPGVWKICRKADRIEYLAHDITSGLTSNPSNPAEGGPNELQLLLTSEKTNIIEPLKVILNHGHMVSFVDLFSVQRSDAKGQPGHRQYAVWEFCDAGNLGNLFVLGQRRFPKMPQPIDEGDWDDLDHDEVLPFELDGVLAKDDLKRKTRSTAENMFLPESFCWHVLVSVMRALSWLHEGARTVPPNKEGKWDFVPDANWEPILHRNIVPENIYFMHPRRNEWYGSCKLGDYSNAFISGHQNGYQDKPEQIRDRSEALAPPRTEHFQHLDELIAQDEKIGHHYPQLPTQPYTRVSEVRAVGEIVQAMMVPPTILQGYHVAEIRTKTVMNNLEDMNYSPILKNLLIWIMSFNPDEKENGEYKWNERHRNYSTSIMCTRVHLRYEEWLNSNHPEARRFITFDNELVQQKYEDDVQLAQNIEHQREIDRVLAKQDNMFEVFYGKPEEEEEVDISITASSGAGFTHSTHSS